VTDRSHQPSPDFGAVSALPGESRVEIYDSAERPPPFIDEFTQLIRYRSLIVELVSRDIKTRYKRSFLGIGWTMLHPLLTMLVLTAVFSAIFRFSVPNYIVYVLSGLLLWNFFSTTTTHAMTQLAWGGSLLSRIYLPKAVFAASSIGTGLVNIALAMVPLLVIMAITQVPYSAALLFLPVAVALTAVFAFGVGLFISTQAVYYTDVVNMYEIILMLWFYLTPIIYPLSVLPPLVARFVLLNPMYTFLEMFRAPINQGTLPAAEVLALGVLWSLVSLTIGWWVFTRKADEFAYRV